MKDDHKKCAHLINELKNTITTLQERLEAKENEIRKIKSTPVHVDVVVRRDKSSDSDIKVTANKSSLEVKKKFTLSDSDDDYSRSSRSKEKIKKEKKPKD